MDFGKLYLYELDKVHSLRDISESVQDMQECIKENLEYIRELEKYVKELEIRCRTDSMTGMWNRDAFEEMCDEMEMSDDGQPFGVIFADINGLKSINDKMGHSYGDEYIKRFGKTLLCHFDKENCYHISGDEFIVILKGISEFDLAKEVGKLSIRLKMKHVPVASLGCAWSENQKDVMDTVLEAEKMMYMDKSRWHNKFYSFGQNVG